MQIELSPDQKLGVPPPKENSLTEIDTPFIFIRPSPFLQIQRAKLFRIHLKRLNSFNKSSRALILWNNRIPNKFRANGPLS